MTIIPIFIPIREKSDKELREEMERDARWNKMMEKEKEKERQRKLAEERKKREKKEQQKRKLEEWYSNLLRTNEWETQILPEGWSIFGQRSFGILTERSKKDFTEKDV